MRLQLGSITGILLIGASAALAAQPIGVTQLDGGTQIWFDAGSFDAKDSNYVSDTTYIDYANPPLSGEAYYVPQQDDFNIYQPWYMEYNINPADVPGVSLSGDWYFYARTIQPLYTDANYDPTEHWPNNSGNDSHLLFVEGDPGDGSGADWYTDSIASADNADDRILNGMDQDPAYGPDTWIWWSGNSDTDVRAKQFNLIDNEVTFRISEREGHELNARIDVIVWSSVAGFVPDDATYQFQAVTPGDGNRDRKVTDADYTVWADNFGAAEAYWDLGDYNWDGQVTDADYTIWADNFGTDNTTPEPATLGLLAIGAAAMIRRRQ